MTNQDIILRMAYGFLSGEFPEVDDASLEDSELHCFVETRISEKIGKMILEGLGHHAFCS